MTRGPWVISKASKAFGRDSQMFDSSFGWRFINPKMKELYGTDGMGTTAENLAEKFNISREDQDLFAYNSQKKAFSAQTSGRFSEEIVTVSIPQRKKEPILFKDDEFIKGNTSLQKRWNVSEKNPYTIIMNKINIPMIGLGTWLIPNDEVESIVKDAISLGYKHIDTAEVYRNEEGIGKALKVSGIPRDEIYITTKMWPGMFGQEESFQTFKGAIEACEQSLQLLQVDEIDLYLIHNPFAKENRLELWEAMHCFPQL